MIIQSNTSSTFLNNLIREHEIKNWIYLGNDHQAYVRLNKVFADDQYQEVDYAKELYEMSQKQRTSFVSWMDDISSKSPFAHEWLFSVPATKNPYASHVFLNVCYAFVLKKLVNDGKNIDLIVVDSLALGRLLAAEFKSKHILKIDGVARAKSVLKTALWSVLRWGRFVVECMKKFMAARAVLGQRAHDHIREGQRIVLIRNYITGGFSDSKQDIFEKHFFPGLYEYLANHDEHPVFLAMSVNVKSYRDLFNKIKKSKRRVLIIEEFLKLKDYIYAFLTPFRAFGVTLTIPKFQGFDFSQVVKEEYFNNITNDGLLQSILFLRFGQRFKETKAELKGLINWSEFQSFEKGLVSGLRKAYPKMKLYGSQPFLTPPNHISLFPSGQDKLLNIIPEKIFALGEMGKAALSEYSKDIPVYFSPAFRYNWVLNEIKDTKGHNLLVLFGYGLDNAVHTLKLLLKIKNELKAFDKILIKLHPASYFQKERLVSELGVELPKNFEFVADQLETYLDHVAVGICGATGTAGELVMRGIPVVIIAEKHALTMNYLAHKEDQDIWRLCFDIQEVSAALNDFADMVQQKPDVLKQKALEFRRAYFVDQDESLWKNYLMNTQEQYNYA